MIARCGQCASVPHWPCGVRAGCCPQPSSRFGHGVFGHVTGPLNALSMSRLFDMFHERVEGVTTFGIELEHHGDNMCRSEPLENSGSMDRPRERVP